MSGSISANATTPVVAHGHHHLRTGASDPASAGTTGDTGSGAGAGAGAITAGAGSTGPQFPSDLMSLLIGIGNGVSDAVTGGGKATGATQGSGAGATEGATAGGTAAAPAPDLLQRLANAARSFGTFALNTAGEAAAAGAPV